LRWVALTATFAVSGQLLIGVATAGKPRIPAPPKLHGRVATSGTTSLDTASGVRVRTVRRGWYTVTIRDDTRKKAFVLQGPGVKRTSGMRFAGIVIWGVHLRPGVYRYSGAGKTTPHTFRVR